MDNALPLHVEGFVFDSCWVRLFTFFRSRFVSFCLFLKKKTYRKRFAASIYQEITLHLTVNLNKLKCTF